MPRPVPMSLTLRLKVLPSTAIQYLLRGTTPLLATMLLAACGAGQRQYAPPTVPDASAAGVVEAEAGLAKAVLAQLDTLADGAEVTGTGNGAGSASVGPNYVAANGRTCRSVVFVGTAAAPNSELACRDSSRWFFVPRMSTGNAKGDDVLTTRPPT